MEMFSLLDWQFEKVERLEKPRHGTTDDLAFASVPLSEYDGAADSRVYAERPACVVVDPMCGLYTNGF